MKLSGKTTISRTPSNYGPAIVTIRVQDNSSEIDFLTLTFTQGDFADAANGRAPGPVGIELTGLEYIGLVAEHKQEAVYVPDGNLNQPTPEAIRAALAEFEVNGWKGSDADAGDYKHMVSRRATGAFYSVGFVRYVPAE